MNGQNFLALCCFLKFRFSSRNSFNSWAGSGHGGQNTGISASGMTSGHGVFICPLVLLMPHTGIISHSVPDFPTVFVALLLLRPIFPLHPPKPRVCPQPCDSPSASRGLQCPEGSQGIGEEALKAYCTRTLPSAHRSHADPTSLGGQENRKTHQLSNS